MRLFIAITFRAELRRFLAGLGEAAAAAGVKGRFSPGENLHLTLAFIGESQRREELVGILEDLHGSAFSLEIGGLGRFVKRGGDVLWLGVRESRPLLELYGKLSGALRAAGFSLEERPYRPHITLARQARFPSEELYYDLKKQCPWFKVVADRVSLMESCRLEGRLVYREIWGKTLPEETAEK